MSKEIARKVSIAGEAFETLKGLSEERIVNYPSPKGNGLEGVGGLAIQRMSPWPKLKLNGRLAWFSSRKRAFEDN